ncbi:MAG: hypothetical protein ABSG31_06890 [Tepidisphaeraceae bacterium]
MSKNFAQGRIAHIVYFTQSEIFVDMQCSCGYICKRFKALLFAKEHKEVSIMSLRNLQNTLGRIGSKWRWRHASLASAAVVEKLEIRVLLSTSINPSDASSATIFTELPPVYVTPPAGYISPPASGPPMPFAYDASSSPSTNDMTPAQITNFYDAESTKVNGSSVDGTGMTIGIVDANYDPNISTDLTDFDTKWNLPSATLNTIKTYFTIGTNTYGPAQDATNSYTWALETDLDVEFAHAMAPGATIDVFETNDSEDGLLLGAYSAADYSGVSIVSMSWGFSEFSGETTDDGSIFSTPSGHANILFVAASGDTPANGAQYPASSPNVIGVGGTMLSGGTSGTEEWWTDSEGGASLYEPNPNFQDAIAANENAGSGAANFYNSSYRETPDVAMIASSVSVYDITDGGSPTPWVTGVEGTSLSAPLFSGVLAMVDDGRLNYAGQTSRLDGSNTALPAIYGLLVNGRSSDLNDIESGSGAGPGYDTVTGLGSPNIPSFVNDLANVDSVMGTTGADTITGSMSGSTITIVTDNTTTNTFTAYSGTSIYINGENGADSISLASSVTVPSVLFGWGGADTISGGAGNDFIDGGINADSIAGNAGNDFLAGGAGSDTIGGAGGNDTVVAGLGGSSSVMGGLGTNLYITNQVLADTLTSTTGSTDSGYYDDGPTVYDSIVGTIALL